MTESIQQEMLAMDPRGSIVSESKAPATVENNTIINDTNQVEPPSPADTNTVVQKYEEEEGTTSNEAAVPVNENFLGGQDNPVFTINEATNLKERVIPPVTYIDFLPQLLMKAGSKTDPPQYARFGTLVEQANQWLQGNQEYTAWKCETVMFKLGTDDVLDTDHSLYMESAFGTNKFVYGLRLWLIPRLNSSIPVCQIGSTTVLPGQRGIVISDTGSNMASTMTNIYTKMSDMILGMNRHFMKKPLPGTIMNIETVTFRISTDSNNEFVNVDAGETCWAELGSKARVYVHGIRIFYILGKPEYAQIGHHDEFPKMEYGAMQTILKFSPFQNTVTRMGAWLKSQEKIRIVNLQSINFKVGSDKQGSLKSSAESMGNLEMSYLVDARYAKVLRAYYIINPKSESGHPYESLNLTTRLFTPVRIVDREFESFSKTMQRVIKWFDHTKIPPFYVETLQYVASVMSYGDVIQENKSDMTINRNNGRYLLTTVRFYFPSEFSEPPPEISPQVEESYAISWGCSIS